MKMKKSETNEPYYRTIKDPESFLHHYISLHKDHYSRMKHAAIARLFPIVKYERILDVGCGGGFYSLLAARKGGSNILLVDVESVCIKAAKLNLSKNAGLKTEGIVASATSLPLRSEMFDLVLCIDLIEHIRSDNILLKEAKRILNAGGSMLISTQNSYSLNYIIEGFFNRHVLKNQKWMGWDPSHVRFYNPKSLFLLLRNMGFEITGVSGTYFMPYNLFFWKGLPSFLSKISRAFGLFVKKFNDILEMRCQKILLRTFGWGIICSCTKSLAPLENPNGNTSG
jgi:2-polyprenyl-6-hydroxyphenyl methylase/3-demethylubiquinone-9 3-methyltransferase